LIVDVLRERIDEERVEKKEGGKQGRKKTDLFFFLFFCVILYMKVDSPFYFILNFLFINDANYNF
jgi:hypothetical protein